MTDGTIERVSVFDGWTVDDLEDARPTILEAIDYAISLHNKDISTTSKRFLHRARHGQYSRAKYHLIKRNFIIATG